MAHGGKPFMDEQDASVREHRECWLEGKEWRPFIFASFLGLTFRLWFACVCVGALLCLLSAVNFLFPVAYPFCLV
jgi:hypothetical protein